jgi:RNA polymerase sigma-70 factor (ECF subfamily)
MQGKGLDILEACKKGDIRSQRIFYDRFKSRIFPMCLRYSNSREDAEDVLQEGFIKVFRDLYQYKGNGSLEGWVRKVILNVALDHLKKQKRTIQTNDLSDKEYRLRGEDLVFEFEEENASHLIKLMQKMPPGFRTVLNLYVLEGYTHPQISEVLGISIGTSKSQLNRAKKFMRSLVEKSLTK